MPLIQPDTSFTFPDQSKRQAIAETLSQMAAEGTGKPEQYVMTCIRDNVAMTMSGAPGPCALVTFKTIGGLSKPVNQAIAAKAGVQNQFKQVHRFERFIASDLASQEMV